MEKLEKLALTIDEVCELVGVSRTSLYEVIARRELSVRKRGRRTLVLVDDLKKWIGSLPEILIGGQHERAE
jgi:excisionase family DNA binding protein